MSTENQDQEVVTKKKRSTKAAATKSSETTPTSEAESSVIENQVDANPENVAESDQTSTDGAETEQVSVSEQVDTSSEEQQPELSSEQASETTLAAETDSSVIENQVDEPKVQGSLEQSPVNLSELPALLNIQNDQKLEVSEIQSLSELELEVTNNGRSHTCLVSNAVLRPGETVVIKYKTVQLKRLAATNFNQLNALAGKQRFELKEG
ncbi:hypothetical protein KPE71_14175 [Acinetobacter soli]|uniref:hypothetical protein n=1 Tax=Acinetobacter soli TaxID=487316 RepID=UPI001C0D2297|nr:hypothetical protein [Acinetobacter soli]MBU3121399.1 hypothetical protein [Acinetobacter soli]